MALTPDQVQCVVCGRARSRGDAETLTLTAKEKETVNRNGQAPINTISYCRPCFRLMSDQRTALDLMKGSLIARLRVLGVADPEKVAESFKNKLLAKSTKRSS